MAKLYVMVGLPGSGKTTYAHSIKGENIKVFSSDLIRKELYGDESIQGDNDMIFRMLESRIEEHLTHGDDAVHDATNLREQNREKIIRRFRHTGCEFIAVNMLTDYNTCLERNAGRDRKVPEEVIERMNKGYTRAKFAEGWDKIRLVLPDWMEE